MHDSKIWYSAYYAGLLFILVKSYKIHFYEKKKKSYLIAPYPSLGLYCLSGEYLKLRLWVIKGAKCKAPRDNWSLEGIVLGLTLVFSQNVIFLKLICQNILEVGRQFVFLFLFFRLVSQHEGLRVAIWKIDKKMIFLFKVSSKILRQKFLSY